MIHLIKLLPNVSGHILWHFQNVILGALVLDQLEL